MTITNTKEALKQLRQRREASIARARQMIKAQNKQFTAIRSQLKDTPRTVPQIAAAVGIDTAQVLVTIAALRKYGEVVEDQKDGDYFTYRLADGSTSK